MKNFNTIKLVFAIFLMSAFGSCKKLIEIPDSPPSKLSTADIFSDSTSAIAAVAGVYNNFGITTSTGQNFGNGLITELTAISSDELISNSSFSNTAQFYQNNILSNNPLNAALWNTAYQNMYQINVCLEGVNASNALSESFKNQVTGELKVVRAYYYFYMVNIWGDVPLVLLTDFKKNQALPRLAVDKVYENIIADLTDAQKKLKPDYVFTDKARPNLYVAETLLAKVYLYLGNWEKAKQLADDVINSGTYSLTTDLNEVFLEGSSEAIWQLPAVGRFNQTQEALLFIPFAEGIIPDFSVSSSLLNQFECGDLRKSNWLQSTTVNVNGTSTDYYYPYKYKNTSSSSAPAEAYMLLRLADLYLIRAEASARLNNIAAAAMDINRVRARARAAISADCSNPLPDIKSSINQSQILAAIAHERQIELFAEWGNRWLDLKRTGAINTVMSSAKSNWKPFASLYPIPLAELRLNPFLLQNPGY